MIHLGFLTYQVDKSFSRGPICLGEHCCLPGRTEKPALITALEGPSYDISASGQQDKMCVASWTSFHGSNCSEGIKRLGQCLLLPVNDGMIWKQSSQYSGLMSIYLQGVCSSLPFYLSKHIWCPVVEASKSSVCFPVDASSLFLQIGALVVGLWGVWKKNQTSCFAPWNLSRPWSSQVCGFGHKSNKKHLNSAKSAADNPPYPPSFRLQLSVG